MVVTCPGCGNKYSIDDRKVPATGASLTCRECGRKWKALKPLEVAPPQDPLDPQAEAPAEASLTPTGGMPATSVTAALSDSSASLQRPVNCPKCGHHFVPYASRATGSATDRHRRVGRPRGRVLLVEDQKYFAELTCEALEADYETTVTSTLAEARTLIAAGGVDLVILDLALEDGEDGTHVLNATRKQDIPVLIFTARDETELYGGVWDSLKAAGATDILIKGVNVGEELRQKVKALLSSQRK